MTRRERAQVKRRTANDEQAIDYLKAALTSLPGRRMGTAVQQACKSPRPMTTAKAIVKGWRQVSGNGRTTVEDGLSVRDLSAATEACATLLRRQPPSLRRWAAYEDEIGELERALRKGYVRQNVFDGRCRKIAKRPLPSRMAKAGEPEMSLERRVQKLEAQQPDENWECHRIIVDVGQSQEEAIRQHFGEQGPPENAFLILRTIVDPPPRREAP